MKCRICGKETKEVIANKLRRGRGIVYRCPYCNYGMLEPEFDNAKKYYDEEYRKHFKDKITDEKRETARLCYEMQKDYQGDRLKIISAFFNEDKDFLEIGSSAGQFLSHIVGKFKTLTGIELDATCAEFCERLIAQLGAQSSRVYTDSIEQIEWEDNKKFDYIGFFQVLEHIEDPIQFLKNVNNRMKDDGRCFIEVPNLDDPLLKLWKVPAYETFYYHEAHLSYFTEESLGLMLEKCGFEIESIHFLQDYNLLNNIFWYFNNGPQDSNEFGLSAPHVDFRVQDVGDEINDLFVKMNEEYVRILAKHKMTSNIFIVAKKNS